MVNQPWEKWIGRELDLAFRGIGNVVVLPVGIEEIEGAGFGVTFYVGWGVVSPTTYSHVSQVVEQFRGLTKWSIEPELNNRGAFISALPLDQVRKSFDGQHNVEQVSLSDLHKELQGFCRFVKESLHDAGTLPKDNQELRVSAEPFQDSEYRVFLVAQPEQFSGGPTSLRDRMLHFGVAKDEWVILSREADENLRSLSNLQALFLSRLKQLYEIVWLSPNDVVLLTNELVGSESGITDATLKGAVQKLQRIFLEASQNKLGVVFEPNN